MFSELCGVGPTIRVYQEVEILKSVLGSIAKQDEQICRGHQDWFRSLLCKTISSGWEEGALAIITSPPPQFREITLSPLVLTTAVRHAQLQVIRTLISKGVKPDGSTWDGVFWAGIQRMQHFLARKTARLPIPGNLSLSALIGSNNQALVRSERQGMAEYAARLEFSEYVDGFLQWESRASSTRSLRAGFQMAQLHDLHSNGCTIPAILTWVITAECSGFFSGLAASLLDHDIQLIWEIGGSHFLPAAIRYYSLSHGSYRDEDGNSPRKVIMELISIASRLGLINDFNPHGKTALHYAIEGRMLSVIDLLLKHGATPTIPTCDGPGLTPLELVIQQLCLPDSEVKRSNNALFRIISALTQHDAGSPPRILESYITTSDMAIIMRELDLENWHLKPNTNVDSTLCGDKVWMSPEMETLRT